MLPETPPAIGPALLLDWMGAADGKGLVAGLVIAPSGLSAGMIVTGLLLFKVLVTVTHTVGGDTEVLKVVGIPVPVVVIVEVTVTHTVGVKISKAGAN